MIPLETGLLLLGLPVGMILAGYWLAIRLPAASAGERLAFAALAGLGALLWNVSVVSLFRPLAGAWAWACLWPIAFTLAGRTARAGLMRDFVAVTFNRRGAMAMAAAAGLLGLLLWPLFSRPGLVFYDGTGNHDAYFWIASASHLMRHTYLEASLYSATQPTANFVGTIIGWQPEWGRMGAEGLLALSSALSGKDPAQLYVVATAALLVPWVAAVFLVTRTFLVSRLTVTATVALIALQPMFVFFHGNANLPNLLGTLMGAAVVVGAERSLRAETARQAWLALLVLGLHGLLCVYPEMLPFVGLSAGLLWARACFASHTSEAWYRVRNTALAACAAFVINPASSLRAWSGALHSIHAVQVHPEWVDLFRSLAPGARATAMATLSPHFGHDLGAVAGIVCCLALLGAAGFAVARSHDRVGVLALLAGAGALLAYTLIAHFDYGWQKTAQFAAIAITALLPVTAINALSINPSPEDRRPIRYARWSAVVALLALFGYVTVVNGLESHKWSERKSITRDWFALRDYAQNTLHDAPVLIDGLSFDWPFFYCTWAPYFLPDSRVYYTGSGAGNRIYLQPDVIDESVGAVPPTRAVLVSGEWAASFDANSPRLFVGDSVALLRAANRVMLRRGLQPEIGVPKLASNHIELEIRPHSRSELRLELMSNGTVEERTIRWLVTCQTDGAPTFSAEISGPPPWRIAVPLAAQRLNHINFVVMPGSLPARPWSFAIDHLRVENVP